MNLAHIHFSDEILAIAKALVQDDSASIIRVNALAGTGKTTLLQILEAYHNEYWTKPYSRPQSIFLAYSRLLVDEGKTLFTGRNVLCMSVYELAQRYYGERKVVNASAQQSYSWEYFARYFHVGYNDAYEIATLFQQWLKSSSSEESIFPYDIQSDVSGAIFEYVQNFITDVRCGEENTFITAEFLLKEFQLDLLKTQSIAPVDLLLVDEAQDLSDAALSVILHYPARKRVLVGDTNQKIYPFVSTKNALMQTLKEHNVVDFPLSLSYRHKAEVAMRARSVLRLFKGQSECVYDASSNQMATPPAHFAPCGMLCATHLGLFNALKLAYERGMSGLASMDLNALFALPLEIYAYESRPERVHFSLKELLSVFQKSSHHKSFLAFLLAQDEGSFKGDVSRAMSVVRAYSNDELQTLLAYANAHMKGNDVVICTVHKAKGFEFERVIIMDDFKDLAGHVAEYFISTQNTEKRGSKYDFVAEFGAYIHKRENSFYNEKDVSFRTYPINLYYTALTRARAHIEDRSGNERYEDKKVLNEAIFKQVESAKRKEKKEAKFK